MTETGSPSAEPPVRLAGRVIAVDPDGRVLLFGYDDPPPKGKHWATPGGGVEEGEDFYSAARRELVEETGWPDVPVSPELELRTGMAYYDPPGKPVTDSVRERATVVAFDLTTCDGTFMYEAIEWYFPESGGTFSPGQYLDDCSWTVRGNQ